MVRYTSTKVIIPECWCYTNAGPQAPHTHDPQSGCPIMPIPEPPLERMTSNQRAIDDLVSWWEELASKDARTTVPKAIEYGSADLIEIGRAMARATGRRDLTDAQAAELGIYFYLVGKLGRWTAAVEENRPVSDDTLFDISVYITMVRRIRATGGWPYATAKEGGK